MEKDFLLIGVDGGATKVSAWQIEYNKDNNLFSLGKESAGKTYSDLPGFINNFKPVDVGLQLTDQADGKTEANDDEKQQETVYVEACALVIEELVHKTGKNSVLFGLGMPGLKTEDKRGIAVVANGPRMFNYSNMLEQRLKLSNINIISPVHQIGSDADYCGIGENYSADGSFKSVANAYYLGGGTGVADALKLSNELVPFDGTKPWLAKTWEMKSEDGRSLERFTSAGGIQSVYAQICGKDTDTLNKEGIYPLQISEMVLDGDKQAQEAFRLLVEQLSLLLYERITTIYCGWKSPFKFVNPNRPPLSPEHNFKGTLLEKIIIGQRLGELMASAHGQQTVFEPLAKRLANLVETANCLDAVAKQHYANPQDYLKISRLREAPAIGAGIDAFHNYTRTI